MNHIMIVLDFIEKKNNYDMKCYNIVIVVKWDYIVLQGLLRYIKT